MTTIERRSAKWKLVKTGSSVIPRASAGSHQHTRGPVSQRAVGDVGVSGDPADVRRAPVDVIGLVVKHQFVGGGGVEHVAADCVKDSLYEVEKKG